MDIWQGASDAITMLSELAIPPSIPRVEWEQIHRWFKHSLPNEGSAITGTKEQPSPLGSVQLQTRNRHGVGDKVRVKESFCGTREEEFNWTDSPFSGAQELGGELLACTLAIQALHCFFSLLW